MSDRVLITMDDLEAAVRANAAFEASDYDTVMVSQQEDWREVVRDRLPDVIALTGGLHEPTADAIMRFARERGVASLGLIEEHDPDPADFARELGLTAWLVKPVAGGDVVQVADRLIARRRLQARTGIIGESAAIQEVLVKIEQMAPVSSTVLVEGESGSGKELVAQAIHQLSPRRDQSFIAVNCGALPETLLESELFGHEKGAFTGASERRLGRFELADGGTIFLDEVGEMQTSLQVKLLRILENRSFFRVGGTQPIRADVRVVAATNKSLKERVALGEFRDDLFYRLNVLYIYLPPLRERKRDIPILVKRFIRELSDQHGRDFRGITPEAMDILVNAHWPGNVRQLRNLIESMVVLAPGREIHAADIPPDIREGGTRLLPVRMPDGQGTAVQGNELEFIFRSLVELRLQIERLQQRMNERPAKIEVEPVRGARYVDYELGEVIEVDEPGTLEERENNLRVLYRPGMTMADVEKAAIEAALSETRGNRRKAAERLGIGERTLYRKIKEYELA